MSLNTVSIMGRLSRDPELRRTGNNIAVASFCVAVDRDYAPKGEEKQPDWIDCVAWRNTAEFIAKYFKKGDMIVVNGRLETRTWADKDGNKHKATEVVAENAYFGGKKQDGNANATGAYGAPQGQGGYNYSASPAPAQGSYGNAQQQGGYNNTQQQNNYGNAQQQGGGYAPAPQQGGYAAPQGGYQYAQPAAGNFAMLNDDDAQLPF